MRDWGASEKEKPGCLALPLSFRKHLQLGLHLCDSSSYKAAAPSEAQLPKVAHTLVRRKNLFSLDPSSSVSHI